MKQIATVIIILINGIIMRTNAQIEVSGQVKDNSTNDALMYVSVSVYNLQDSLISGAITNDKGYFKIPLAEGSYSFICSFIGYYADTLRVKVERGNDFIGIISLKNNVSSIKEVEIVGSTSEFTIDKDVQLVTENMRSGAANTSDVLGRLKGLTYDRYNNSIKVDGDDRVIILVNGLEKNQEYIKNLSPDRIKEVEIIRNPGGRYALEGYSAIINVVLKSDYRGSEIYVENLMLLDPDTKEGDYIPVNNFSLTYNYTYNKLNFYAKAADNYTNVGITGKSKQETKNGDIVESTPFGEVPNMKVHNLYNTYTAGVDFYINPRHTLSLESNISAFPPSDEIVSFNYDVAHYNKDILMDSYTSKIDNNSKTQDFTNSLFYIFKIDNRNKLNADFTYSNYSQDYSNSIFQSNGFESNETGVNKKDYMKLYLEFNHVLTDRSNIMVGYGNTWRQIENNYFTGSRLLADSDVINDTSHFILSETRHKLYAYYSLKMSAKTSFKIGAASEYSHPKAGELEKVYMIYQPYLDFLFAAHKFLDIKLMYRANSGYPDIRQTTPFTHIIDPYTVESGNPNLKPELTHNVSVKFRILEGLISLEPYYSFSKNRINRILTPLNDSLFEYGYENAGNYISKGDKGDITIPLFKQSFIIQTNFDFFRSSIAYNGKTNTVNDWVMKTQMIYINKKFETLAGLEYQKEMKKIINTQGYDCNNNDYWLLFVQQPILKKKMTVMLGYMLPINFGVDYEQVNYTDTELYTATSGYNLDLIKNLLLFRVTYRFSNGKSVRNIEKEIESESEKKSEGLF